MGRTPEYYRQRAEESRTMAENEVSEALRADLLSMAEQYEHLARQAESQKE